MNKQLTFNWKAEVDFQGNPEDFARVAELLKAPELSFKIWPYPIPFPGIWPVDWRVVIGEARAKELLEGTEEMAFRFIKDIAGGIRDPHLHIDDRVVLVDRVRFKEVVAEVARELAARRVERMADYNDVMTAIYPLSET